MPTTPCRMPARCSCVATRASPATRGDPLADDDREAPRLGDRPLSRVPQHRERRADDDRRLRSGEPPICAPCQRPGPAERTEHGCDLAALDDLKPDERTALLLLGLGYTYARDLRPVGLVPHQGQPLPRRGPRCAAGPAKRGRDRPAGALEGAESLGRGAAKTPESAPAATSPHRAVSAPPAQLTTHTHDCVRPWSAERTGQWERGEVAAGVERMEVGVTAGLRMRGAVTGGEDRAGFRGFGRRRRWFGWQGVAGGRAGRRRRGGGETRIR